MSKHMIVVYDGECPFCSEYVRLVRLRQQGIEVELLNARHAETFTRLPDLDRRRLDRGMEVRWRGVRYEGAEAVRLISALVEGAPLARFLKTGIISKITYPLFRSVRRIALFARRAPLLGDAASAETREPGPT